MFHDVYNGHMNSLWLSDATLSELRRHWASDLTFKDRSDNEEKLALIERRAAIYQWVEHLRGQSKASAQVHRPRWLRLGMIPRPLILQTRRMFRSMWSVTYTRAACIGWGTTLILDPHLSPLDLLLEMMP